MEEIWKPIKDFDNYFVSNLGRVKSNIGKEEKILKPNYSSRNASVGLYRNKILNVVAINSLVAQAFLGYIPNLRNDLVIYYKDDISSNTAADNLEIITSKENRNRIHTKKYGCIVEVNSKEYQRIGYLCKRENISRKEFFNNRDKYDVSTRRKKHLHLELYGNDYYKTIYLKKYYHITLEDYNQLLISQNYVCAICGKPEHVTKNKNSSKIVDLSVDHDHLTGKVRGLLCATCNFGLGSFKDNIEVIKKAILYIENANTINFQIQIN